ncbi:hypothetical protein [Holdemania filiformis]|uniref:Uncharacterized protein n=1 Tax=Holdemania filiformis TaxID=61171 RepID=A0A412FY72_9FIRM|nr:hypothetical protein [Holdemania filiformis]MBS5002994.1 hypothetical protein [Holdemania filiformis]RGR73125.1 hypothetical protein DWY25_11240 [Holdemania filiformis]
MKIKLEAELKTGVSKAGKPFEYLALSFPNGYDKMIFLSPAEKYMLQGILSDQIRNQQKA